MKKILLFLLVAILTCTTSFVQSQCNAPVVNSFSPNTGFIGSSVIITGANFDAIPANNQVFFGATQATVTAASFGQLTVTVPVGATYGPISVRNACNLIGSSTYPFNGIFCGTTVTAQTYNTLTYSKPVSGGYQMLSQDMDLDGKPDVLVCGFTTNKVSVMRNLSTPGNFNFDTKFDLNFAGATRCIAPADYDGDGKIDLAVVDNGINGIRIYRNTSVPGTLSFSGPYDVPNIGGYQCAAGDLNNDGKIDLAVGSGSNVVTLRNTSTVGSISFAVNTSTNIGGSVTGLVVTDVDGDGVKDLGAANAGGNTLHAVRNTTAAGATTFTFASVQTFTTGNYPYRLFVGDFDKDGKIDFANNDFSGGTVSVFRNTSTPGSISFATKVTLTARSSNYRLGVGDADGDGRPDIVSKSSGENFFSVFVNTSTGPGNIAFASRLDYPDPAEVSGIVIADLDGDYVPDISTSGINSNALKIFRNNSTVIDNTPPTAACKNIIVALSPSGSVTVTAAMIDNGSSDACGIGSLQINNSASVTFTCANLGPNTVTLKVTDRAGNISTCTATVTVAPAAIIVAGQTTVCQGQTVVLNANLGDSYQWQKDGTDMPGATSQTYTATVSGNYTVTVTNAGGCSGTSAPTVITVNTNPTVNTFPTGTASLCPPGGTVTISASTSSIYQWKLNGVNISGATQQNYTTTAVGTYSVQVIDLFGCSATSSPITINATDNIPPTAICKNVTVIIAANGTASITAASINNGSFDNCTVASISITSGKTSYTCADAGQTFPVTLTIVDGSGNSSNCTAQVTVTDPNMVCNQPPVAVCQALTVSANANCEGTATAIDFDGGSSDPDAGDVLTFSVFPAGPYAKGITNVTFTVTDAKGASSSCATTITVVDNQPPVIVCQGNINTIATSAAGAAVSYTEPVGTDNCPGVTTALTSGLASGSTFPIGTTIVTYTATDAAGLTANCSFNVIVSGVAPVITTPQNIVINNDAGQCGAVVNFTATETTAIPASTIAYSIQPGSFFPIGTTLVTATATNVVGTSAGTFSVTVTDNQPPVIVCAAPVVVNNIVNTCAANVMVPAPVISDNCNIVTHTDDLDTYTLTNISGQSPQWTPWPGGTSAVVAADQFFSAPNSLQVSGAATGGPVDQLFNIGNQTSGDWILSFMMYVPAGNSGYYNLQKTETPGQEYAHQVFFKSNGSGSLGAAGTHTAFSYPQGQWFEVKQLINQNTDQTSLYINGVFVKSWQYSLKFNGAPGLNKIGAFDFFPVTSQSPVTSPYADVNPSAIPLFYVDDISLTGDVAQIGTYIARRYSKSYPVGQTLVTIKVTDKAGNAANCIQTITVVDNQKPVITSNGDKSVNNDPTKCGAIVSVSASAADNCGVGAPAGVRSDGLTLTDAYPVGTTTISWSVTDIHGNNALPVTQTITVTDNEKPTITAPANITVNNDAGICGAVVSIGTPVTGDNCGVASVVNNYSSTSFPVGTTTVTWTVTDINGNSNQATQTIKVVDNEAPIAKCKPVTVTLVNGAATITAASVNNGSTDNCGIATVSVSKTAFNCTNIGSNSVTLTVTDIYGNVSSCPTTVTVVGEIPTCAIASIPTSNVYTGGNNNNLYLGYGAQSTTLKVTPAANGAPYTYSWTGAAVGMLSSPTSGSPVFTPTSAGNYSFTVTTTNVYGCTTTCSISICVSDIRVPGTSGNNQKVYVCHLPPGNPGNPNILSVSVNAVPAHLSNHAGDRLGSCNMPACGVATASTSSTPIVSALSAPKEVILTTSEEDLKVTVSPNPSNSYFTLKLESKFNTPVNMKVLDASGRVVDAKSKIVSNSTIQIGHNYSSGSYYAEMTQGTTRKVIQLIKSRG